MLAQKCAIGLRHTGRRVHLHWVANLLSPAACSLDRNNIGVKGAVELTKVLPQCMAVVSLR